MPSGRQKTKTAFGPMVFVASAIRDFTSARISSSFLLRRGVKKITLAAEMDSFFDRISRSGSSASSDRRIPVVSRDTRV